MDEKRQVQKELFEEFTGSDKKKHFKSIFSPKPKRTINLLYEHLIFIAMAFIIGIAVSFSIGVERGKGLVLKRDVSLTSVQRQKQQPQPVEALKAKEEPKKEEGPAAYIIQIGSYLKKEEAEKEALSLKKKGYNASVIISGKFHVVCVGEFKSKEQASELFKKLSKLYPGSLLKERKGKGY